ncbi:GrpB family protein [Bacillus suaedaesalsae]|uniref:GrpB family protein n=1 Tax=Bacillus suaedaesalsae TaxID=2810349 RepID=A0ABS2DNA5_9BACI|nr:GrpB family protein [Bacillus suaedaesalsae]MBM6619967.1 GrpB family protein [Bacillus suaedaesalsae]
MRKIEVVPYQENWRNLYHTEEQLLRNVLGEQLSQIHHIGSTSIPRMMAKPIIDILIEVNNIDKVDSFNHIFIKIGYEPKGENGIKNRRYFQKGGNDRTHHVHIFPAGHSEVTRHLAFRDYLIAHPTEAKRYEELKRKLASQYIHNPNLYSEGKNELVKELDKKAKKWYE